MKEEELLAIWQKNEKPSLDNFNFEAVKEKVLCGQQKLRRRIKLEVAFTVFIYILLLPFFYWYPRTLLMTPVIVAIWAWYLPLIKNIYKSETDIDNAESLKDILTEKRRFFKKLIRQMRYIGYLGSPVLIILSIWVSGSLKEMLENWERVLGLVVVVQIFIIIFGESWHWFVYRPPLDEIEDLLRQLDETQ